MNSTDDSGQPPPAPQLDGGDSNFSPCCGCRWCCRRCRAASNWRYSARALGQWICSEGRGVLVYARSLFRNDTVLPPTITTSTTTTTTVAACTHVDKEVSQRLVGWAGVAEAREVGAGLGDGPLVHEAALGHDDQLVEEVHHLGRGCDGYMCVWVIGRARVRGVRVCWLSSSRAIAPRLA